MSCSGSIRPRASRGLLRALCKVPAAPAKPSTRPYSSYRGLTPVKKHRALNIALRRTLLHIEMLGNSPLSFQRNPITIYQRDETGHSPQTESQTGYLSMKSHTALLGYGAKKRPRLHYLISSNLKLQGPSHPLFHRTPRWNTCGSN